MSKQDITLNPKILESATKEFLDKGFLGASVKTICENAGVTTGALYKRYKGKAELFDAVVESTYKKIRDFGSGRLKRSINLLNDKELVRIWENPVETYKYQINFLYDNYEGLRLLLISSEGTKYYNFLHGHVEEVTKSTYEFSKEVYKRGLSKKMIDWDTLHMLLSAYWTVLIEPVMHNFTREKALKYAEEIALFFNWKDVLGY